MKGKIDYGVLGEQPRKPKNIGNALISMFLIGIGMTMGAAFGLFLGWLAWGGK